MGGRARIGLKSRALEMQQMAEHHNEFQVTIFLYGPPGVGKSRVGQVLAESLAIPFYDLDAVIEEEAGSQIEEIFAQEGEPGFRQRERLALENLIDGREKVVALGGGALLDWYCRRLVESSGRLFFLDASRKAIQARLQRSTTNRPLLGADPGAGLMALLEKRREHYESFTHRLDVDQLSAEQASWEIQVRLGVFRVGGMGIFQGARTRSYPVRVLPGGLETLGWLLASQGIHGRTVLVSDDQVAPLYADRALRSLELAGFQADVEIIPAGEQHKNLISAGWLWDRFLAHGLDRRGSVVALGGGMVTDLAGFAAALYQRGVAWAAVPTSLLGMVDASIGGKTGVNLPQGKNLVGAFYPPSLVLADPQVLVTLPEAELRSGLAEVIKHGVIADPALFALCASGLPGVKAGISEVVRRGMAVKIRVVSDDPYEQGLRESLNLGHTLGHALEKASGFNLRHGEAVAIGLAVAAPPAERLGLAEAGLAAQIRQALLAAGLPVCPPAGWERGEIERLMGVDKKKQDGRLRFVLPERIGSVRRGVQIDNLNILWEAMEAV